MLYLRSVHVKHKSRQNRSDSEIYNRRELVIGPSLRIILFWQISIIHTVFFFTDLDELHLLLGSKIVFVG